MSGQHDDPAGHAGERLGQAFAVLAAAAEAFAQLQATRATERAARSQQAAADARAQLRARHAADRMAWAPLLDAQRLPGLSVPDTLAGWGAARSWPQDPEAQSAQRLAEARLSDLRPEAMRRYREQVDLGLTPDEAMRDAAWLLDRDPARFTGERGPTRPELENAPSATVTDLEARRRSDTPGAGALDDGRPTYQAEGASRVDAAAVRPEDQPWSTTEPREAGVAEASEVIDGVVLNARTDLYQRCFPGDELVVEASAVLVAMEADNAVQALGASLAPAPAQAAP